METNALLDTAANTLEHLVGGTRTDQLDDPTPCTKWRVRDLINHVVGGGHVFAMGFRGDPMPDVDGPMPDMLGDDPKTAVKAALADFYDGLQSPGAMERMVTLPIGSIPAPVALQIASFDLLVHCWDLATATGQPLNVSDDVIASADAAAHQLIAPAFRDGDTFGAEVAVPDDATPIQRFVAFTGRDPMR